MLYSQLGCVNAAMKACEGTMLNSSRVWYTSTELGSTNLQGVWSLTNYGNSGTGNAWLKNTTRYVRAVRNF